MKSRKEGRYEVKEGMNEVKEGMNEKIEKKEVKK